MRAMAPGAGRDLTGRVPLRTRHHRSTQPAPQAQTPSSGVEPMSLTSTAAPVTGPPPRALFRAAPGPRAGARRRGADGLLRGLSVGVAAGSPPAGPSSGFRALGAMTTPAHVPVLLDRVVALLDPRAGPRRRGAGRRDPRPRRPQRGRAGRLGLRAGGRRRPRPRGAPPGAGAAGAVRRPLHRRARGLRRDPRRARRARPRRRPTPCSSTSASPRCSSTSRERGFAYAEDAPLDMRMDPTTGPTAADVLNTYDRRRAGPRPAGVRRGEVRPPDRRGRGARARASSRSPRSARLVELLYDAIPAPARRTGGHPAKRTFQALRMEVNDELGGPAAGDPGRVDVLGGRRPRGRGVLPLARGPPGQAGVRRRHPRRRPDRTCRSSPPTASRPCALVTRGAERADRRRGRRTTHVPPRSGCAPSNGSAPAREQHDHPTTPCQQGASRRGRTAQRGHRMSSTAPVLRTRVPRLAGAALERARLTVVPRRRRRRSSPVPFVTGDLDDRRRRRRRAPPLQHLDAAGVLRRHRPRAPRRHPAGPAADAADGARQAARPAVDRAQGAADGDGAAHQPGRPRPAHRQGARRTAHPPRRIDHLRLLPPPPPKPASLDPSPASSPSRRRPTSPPACRIHRSTPATPHPPTAPAPVDKAPPAATADAPSPPVTESEQEPVTCLPRAPAADPAPVARPAAPGCRGQERLGASFDARLGPAEAAGRLRLHRPGPVVLRGPARPAPGRRGRPLRDAGGHLGRHRHRRPARRPRRDRRPQRPAPGHVGRRPMVVADPSMTTDRAPELARFLSTRLRHRLLRHPEARSPGPTAGSPTSRAGCRPRSRSAWSTRRPDAASTAWPRATTRSGAIPTTTSPPTWWASSAPTAALAGLELAFDKQLAGTDGVGDLRGRGRQPDPARQEHHHPGPQRPRPAHHHRRGPAVVHPAGPAPDRARGSGRLRASRW